MRGARFSVSALLRMNSVLAIRNLVHDRVRLIVTLVGIVFSVVLINSEFGLLLGFTRTTSSSDRSGACRSLGHGGGHAQRGSGRRYIQTHAVRSACRAGRCESRAAQC